MLAHETDPPVDLQYGRPLFRQRIAVEDYVFELQDKTIITMCLGNT